jgi:hypothetical protein
MNKVILTCCGAFVSVGAEQIGCPACGARWSAAQIEALQVEELAKIPVVDPLRAGRMLARTVNWILQQRSALEAMHSVTLSGTTQAVEVGFPLTALRRFATERNLAVRPLAANSVLWVDRSRL